jgi:hypothetical protein
MRLQADAGTLAALVPGHKPAEIAGLDDGTLLGSDWLSPRPAPFG